MFQRLTRLFFSEGAAIQAEEPKVFVSEEEDDGWLIIDIPGETSWIVTFYRRPFPLPFQLGFNPRYLSPGAINIPGAALEVCLKFSSGPSMRLLTVT